ncbi:MAG: CBS domain-containing protein [Anaerolineae bacterium]
MTTVSQLLQHKGSQVWSIAPNATVYAALELMAAKNIGAVLVMEGENLVGILSERDYARKVILKNKLSKDTFVHEIMTAPVVCVRPDQTIEDCMALMTNKRIRHLPVIEGNQVIGVVSIGDVVRSVISEQEYTIEQLENFITGKRS